MRDHGFAGRDHPIPRGLIQQVVSISVITPSFNQGQFIERTLASVLSQGIASLEYVVFDGGSTDETVAILRKYEDRLRWISEPDRGQAHAVNKGIAATKGEIVGWINSDDIYYSGTLLTILRYFAENPGADVVYGDAFYMDAYDNRLGPYNTEPWDFQKLKTVCYLCQPATFFRRRMVERFGLLDETLRFCMDYEFWLRLAQGGATFAYFPVPLAGSRMWPHNKTLSNRVVLSAEINHMLKAKLGTVPDQWIRNYAYARREAQGLPGGLRGLALSAALYMAASLQWNHQGIHSLLSKMWTIFRRRR